MRLSQSQHLYHLLQIISNQLLEWGGGCSREIIGRKWKWPWQSWTIQWQPSKLELSQSKPAFTNRTVGCVGDKKSHSTAKLIGVCGCGSGPGLTSRLRPAERFICQKGIIFSNQVFINFQFLNYHHFIRVIGWIKRPLYLFSTDAFTRDHRYGLLLPSPSCQALWGGAYHLLCLIRTISSTLINFRLLKSQHVSTSFCSWRQEENCSPSSQSKVPSSSVAVSVNMHFVQSYIRNLVMIGNNLISNIPRQISRDAGATNIPPSGFCPELPAPARDHPPRPQSWERLLHRSWWSSCRRLWLCHSRR